MRMFLTFLGVLLHFNNLIMEGNILLFISKVFKSFDDKCFRCFFSTKLWVKCIIRWFAGFFKVRQSHSKGLLGWVHSMKFVILVKTKTWRPVCCYITVIFKCPFSKCDISQKWQDLVLSYLMCQKSKMEEVNTMSTFGIPHIQVNLIVVIPII